MDRLRLEQTIKEYGDGVYSFCVYLTKNRTEADDLYQDALLKAIELDEIDFYRNPKNYLIGIAINLWRNKLRKLCILGKKVVNFTARQEEITSLSAGGNPQAEAEKDEVKARVRAAVNSLPDRYRIPVLMYYNRDMSVGRISEILNIPQGTVKSRLHKARMLLGKQLEDLL